jgi:hypothetical protein
VAVAWEGDAGSTPMPVVSGRSAAIPQIRPFLHAVRDWVRWTLTGGTRYPPAAYSDHMGRPVRSRIAGYGSSKLSRAAGHGRE